MQNHPCKARDTWRCNGEGTRSGIRRGSSPDHSSADIPGLLPDCDLHMPTVRQAGKTEWTHLLQVLAGLRRGAGSQLLHMHCWPGTLLS